jgi:hypothetical protein
VNVTNCVFQGNQNNIVGSPGVFDNCQFINNEFGFAEAYGHTIQNCYFSQNNVGVENTGGSTIVNSIFENNTLQGFMDEVLNIKDVKVGNKIPDIIISFVGISSNVLEVNNNKEKPYYFQEFNFVKTGENEYRGVPVYDDKTIPRYKSIDELMKAHPKAVKDTRYGNSNENKRYIQNNYPTKE